MNLKEVYWTCRLNFHPEHGFLIFASLEGSFDDYELIHNLPYEETYRVLTSHEIDEFESETIVNLDYLSLIKLCNPNTKTSRSLRAKFAVGFVNNLREKGVELSKIEYRRITGYIMSCSSNYFGGGFYDFKTFEIFWKRYSYSQKLRKIIRQNPNFSSDEEASAYYFTHERGKRYSISEFIRRVDSKFFDNPIEPKYFLENWASHYNHDVFVDLSMGDF